MGFFDNYMQKIAVDIDVEKEKELIKKVQKNPNDYMTWKQLKIRFDKAIKMAIRQANITVPNIAPETLKAAAMEEFERSILNYSEATNNKPSTYIIGNISKNLMKLNYEYMHDTRMPADLALKSQHVFNAESWLTSHGVRNPTVDQIHNTIKDVFGKSNVTVPQIQRIKGYERNELSANLVVGQEGTGENIDYQDIMYVSDSPKDIIQGIKEKEKLEVALAKLTPRERKIISEYRGIGEYSNKKNASYGAIAINNNLGSAYEAQKLIRQIEDKLRNELMKI